MKRIAVIGAGNWGTALAIMAARKGHEVHLWSRNPRVIASLNQSRINHLYLPQVMVPNTAMTARAWLRKVATNDVEEVLCNAELVILASPSHVTRELLRRMSPHLREEMILVSATKGIEIETGKRMSQIV